MLPSFGLHAKPTEQNELRWLLLLLVSVLQSVAAKPDVCNTWECAVIGTKFRFTMNTGVNPCDDFYEFACGKNDYQMDSNSVVNKLKLSNYHDALTSQRNSSVYSIRLASVLYGKCLSPDTQPDTDSLDNLEKQLDNDYVENDRSLEELIRFAMLESRDTMFQFVFEFSKREQLWTYALQPLVPKTPQEIDDEFSEEWYYVETASSLRDFETKLSKISQGPSVLQTITVEDLDLVAPNINWATIFGSDVPENKTILVNAPLSWLSDLNVLVVDTDDEVLKAFAAHQMVQYYINAAKMKRSLTDYEWIQRQFCYELVATLLPRITQTTFAVKHISASRIGSAKTLVEEIRSSLIDLYSNNEMLGKESRANAIESIKSVRTRMGYMNEALKTHNDEAWKELADRSESLSFIDLYRNISRSSGLKAINMIREPLTEDVLDQYGELQLYNFLTLHTIFVPATYLQSPLFEPNGPRFYWYGLMGSLIGHEFMHSLIYDDVVFDNDQMNNSIRKSGNKTIQEQTEGCFTKQYDNYTVDQGKFRVNGSFTLVENMADHGGLAASYQAYMKSIERDGRDRPLRRLNYTSEQLFFLSYAQYYCPHQPTFDPKDVHAPNKVRVLGVASNSPEFSKAFNCPIGSPMNPVKKCNIWPTSSSSCFTNLTILITLIISLC